MFAYLEGRVNHLVKFEERGIVFEATLNINDFGNIGRISSSEDKIIAYTTIPEHFPL
jgi:hypothetical protein